MIYRAWCWLTGRCLECHANLRRFRHKMDCGQNWRAM